MNWIKIKDQLPPMSELVLLARVLPNTTYEEYSVGKRTIKFAHDQFTIFYQYPDGLDMRYAEHDEFTHWCRIYPTTVIVQDYI